MVTQNPAKTVGPNRASMLGGEVVFGKCYTIAECDG